jgi:hypothetical protein
MCPNSTVPSKPLGYYGIQRMCFGPYLVISESIVSHSFPVFGVRGATSQMASAICPQAVKWTQHQGLESAATAVPHGSYLDAIPTSPVVKSSGPRNRSLECRHCQKADNDSHLYQRPVCILRCTLSITEIVIPSRPSILRSHSGHRAFERGCPQAVE